MPTILTDQNFAKEIQRKDKFALVDFYATWCEPCSLLAPVLEKLEQSFSDKLVLLKANVDETPLNAQKFKVDLIPTIILFKDGQPIDSFSGFRPEPVLKEWLEKIIKDN